MTDQARKEIGQFFLGLGIAIVLSIIALILGLAIGAVVFGCGGSR